MTVDVTDAESLKYGFLPAEMILQCWNDPKFKSRFLQNPSEHLREAGYEIEPDIKITVVENQPRQIHLVLPEKVPGILTIHELKNQIGESLYGTSSKDCASGTCD